MTRTQAIKAIKEIPGMTAKSTGYDNEIRVAFKGKGNEDSAYYTTDPEDAVGTAKAMSTRYLTTLYGA